MHTGTGTIRPGDELRLRVGFVYYPEFNATVGAGEFLAIYDHRLLWRANAYINEGANDWNDLNPWNESTAINPWNTNGTGGQVALQPWTKWNDHTTVTDSVAYGWGNTDSIPTVKNKLTAQTTAISNYRLQNNEYGGIVWSNDSKAPGENWDNYLFPARIVNANNRWYYLDTFTAEQLAPYLTQQHNYYVNGSAACIPGLTTFIVFCNDAERNPLPHNYEYSQTARSIGVDCAGFVCQSLLYPDNPYNVSGRIEAWDFAENTDYSWPVDNINLLVPGDLLVMPDTPAHKNTHVVIIRNITYENGRIILVQSGLVDVIEATTGETFEWSVINTQSWSDLGMNYIPVRLKSKN